MAEYALHTVYAGICKHPIRHSSPLPSSGSTIDNDVQFCSDCETSKQLEQEHDQARDVHDRLFKESPRRRQPLRDARGQFIATKLAILQHEELHTKRRNTGRRDSGLPGLEENTSKPREDNRRLSSPSTPERPRKSVRFDAMQIHRPEDQYRSIDEFMREHAWYIPGRWADKTGEGFFNTSDPTEAKEEEWQANDGVEEMQSSEVESDEADDGAWEDRNDFKDWQEGDEDLERLTDEELEERALLVESKLSRFQKTEQAKMES